MATTEEHGTHEAVTRAHERAAAVTAALGAHVAPELLPVS